MLNFNWQIPTKFIFGRGAESHAGEELKALGGTRALIHYGGGSVIRSGLMEKVTKSLDEAGVSYVLLGGAVPNPRDTKVYEGIDLARREKCDCVLAVGGGSAIDSAKAIAHGTVYDGDFWDFWCGKASVQKTLPLGCVLTLSATGSESSNSSVIMQESTRLKRGLATEFNRPKFALLNPEWTATLPPYQVACGATDIMAHVMERYFTNETHVTITDNLCEAVLKTVVEYAPIAVKNPADYDAQAEIMWAGTLAHNDTCGVGREGAWARRQLAHALEHVGMAGEAHRRYSCLSGGEKQRVLIARAIAQQTDFLILDEPTNHLDVSCQLDIFDFIKRLNLTVIAAIHDLNMASLYCDRLYVMKAGRVFREGTPAELLTPELIREVYGVTAEAELHPATHRPAVTYLPEWALDKSK